MDTPRFSPGQRPYYGPKDGLSRRAAFPRLAKVVGRAATSLVYKREVEGKENLPKESGYVLSPNHENTFDPIIWMDMTRGDVREMVTIEVFENPLAGTAARLNGAFPVDRFAPSMATLQHSVDVISNGASEVIYPQGGFPGGNQIGGIYKGAAFAAIHGGGKGVVPIGIHIEQGEKKKRNWKDRLTGAALAGAVGATALAGAPLVAAAVAGASAAMIVSGKLGRKLVPQKQAHDPIPNMISGIAGGALGSVGGAAVAVGAAVAAPVLAIPLAVAAGLGGAAVSRAIRSRPVAQVSIQKPILTSDYTADSNGVTAMTRTLHESLAQAKSRLSGEAIDRSLPVFRTAPWEPGEKLRPGE